MAGTAGAQVGGCVGLILRGPAWPSALLGGLYGCLSLRVPAPGPLALPARMLPAARPAGSGRSSCLGTGLHLGGRRWACLGGEGQRRLCSPWRGGAVLRGQRWPCLLRWRSVWGRLRGGRKEAREPRRSGPGSEGGSDGLDRVQVCSRLCRRRGCVGRELAWRDIGTFVPCGEGAFLPAVCHGGCGCLSGQDIPRGLAGRCNPGPEGETGWGSVGTPWVQNHTLCLDFLKINFALCSVRATVNLLCPT